DSRGGDLVGSSGHGPWARETPSRVAMNARARDLAVLLRGILGALPGATSIGLHASERWALVLITAASDEAVDTLGEALGLTCEIRIGKRRWWVTAARTAVRSGSSRLRQ